MKPKFESIKKTYENTNLFKRDIKGNVIFWRAYLINNRIATRFGRLTTDYMSNTPFNTITEPIHGVNIGKSNETSDIEQAYSVLKSTYEDKLKKGYKSYPLGNSSDIGYIENMVDLKNTDKDGFLQPMKAQKFAIGKMKYPVAVQDKINGVRCVAIRTEIKDSLFDNSSILLLSKEGVQYHVEHLYKAIEDIIILIEKKEGLSNIVLDGELYIPNTNVTSIGGAARNPSNILHKQLQFVIFDLSIENISQKQRLEILDYICFNLKHSNTISIPAVYYIGTTYHNSDDAVLSMLDSALSRGYEGLIIRELDSEYMFGQRAKNMRKLKRFCDSEFEILDIIPYGSLDSKVGAGCKIILRNDETDDTFESIPTGTTEYRLSLLKDKESLIGKMATVKYYERTINNIPFHGNVIAIRDYE